MDSADGLIEDAEATGNPLFLSLALGAYGLAFRDADPVGALNALGRGLVIASQSLLAGIRTVLTCRGRHCHGDQISLPLNSAVLVAEENVVVETRTCAVPNVNATPGTSDPNWATRDAERVAKAMLQNVKP